MSSCEDVDLVLCLQEVTHIAREAGKFVLEGFRATKQVEIKQDPWNLVTEYDKATEDRIVSHLTKKFPTHKFIGEESAAETKSKPVLTGAPTWIIDPIDGTTNYVHSFHEICISIALSVNKELEIGVVYNPILNFMFTARKGHGAFLNDNRIHVSKCTEMKLALAAVEVSIARVPRYRNIILRRLKGVAALAHGIRAVGSAALTLCYVANGSLDAYQLDGLQCWDVAAGVVILREAGGTVLDTQGGPFELMANRMLTASTKSLAEEFVDILKKTDTES